MAVTRSMSGTSQRDKVRSDKITAQRDDQVTDAKSGASQEVDAETLPKKIEKRPKKRNRPGILVEPSSDKYFDLDERTLALGIFLDTWKEQRLKNDPDIKFTRESYQAAMREFNSLTDSSKDSYIAEAKKSTPDQAEGAPTGNAGHGADTMKQDGRIQWLTICPRCNFNNLYESNIFESPPTCCLDVLQPDICNRNNLGRTNVLEGIQVKTLCLY